MPIHKLPLRRFASYFLIGSLIWLAQSHQSPSLTTKAQELAPQTASRATCENFELGPPMQLVPPGFKIEFVRDFNNDGWLDLGVVDPEAQLAIWYGENDGLHFR